MNVALDYDGTYTEDPELWLAFVRALELRGHNVWIVTMRYASETADMDKRIMELVDGVVFTGRQAKRKACEERGIKIHVWVDDNPEAVVLSGQEIWG